MTLLLELKDSRAFLKALTRGCNIIVGFSLVKSCTFLAFDTPFVRTHGSRMRSHFYAFPILFVTFLWRFAFEIIFDL